MNKSINTKKFNLLIIVIIIAVVIFTCFFNYIIDPFDIFQKVKINGINKEKPCLSKQERMTKIPQLKLNTDKIDIIFVGSSKTQWWLNTNSHSKISNKNVISMGLSSASIQESIIMAENSILIHPEIEKVYFGLDFFSFSSNFYDTAINLDRITSTKLTKKEVIPLLLSLDTFNYSLQTLIKNIIHKDKQNKTVITHTPVNPKAEHYFEQSLKKYKRDYYSDYALNKEAIAELLEFQDFANKRNVEVIFFLTPSHISDLINIDEHGLLNLYYEFKKLLAENIDFYDLSMINKYNTEPITKEMLYFRDAVHATNTLGSVFANTLYNNSNDYPYITKKNIDYYIHQDKQNYKNYIENNPETVNKVREWLE